MSYLQQQMGFLKFDKRLLEINLKNGTITEAEYQQHLQALNDDVANSEKIDLGGESNDAADSMNGGSHPADTATEAPAMPANNDPFGSGF